MVLVKKIQSCLLQSLLVLTALAVLFACKKTAAEAPVQPDPVYTVTLHNTDEKLQVSDTLRLTPVFDGTNGQKPLGKYEWRSDNPAIAYVSMNPDLSGKVTAVLEGTTTIRFFSVDKKEELAKCNITVETRPDGIVRILAIGNSFSVDALETYLYDMVKASGKKLIIGNLAIAGGSLEQHVTNLQNNLNVYNYTKIDVDGNKTTTFNNTIASILRSERWDYISLQQVSQNAGMYETFTTPLPILHNYVKTNSTNSAAKIILHQTWAYQQNSTHEGFVNYGKNQQTMYNAIVQTYNKAKDLIDAAMVIPAGTAIQNARTSFVKDNLTRDGYHLELTYGRYIAACTWYEKIFGVPATANSFEPEGISEYYRKMAQQAAHEAVQKPDEVTILTDYLNPETDAEGNGVIQISFAGTGVGWNSLVLAQRVDGSIPDLKDKNGNATGISLNVIERFNGSNSNGAASTTTALNMPSGVSTNSFFGNSRAVHDGILVPKSVVKFSGLNKDKTYEFCFFGSRTGVSDNRETQYTCKGSNEVSVLINTANNSTNMACAQAVKPNSGGEIELTVTVGPNNNNTTGFYYINALRITPGAQ